MRRFYDRCIPPSTYRKYRRSQTAGIAAIMDPTFPMIVAFILLFAQVAQTPQVVQYGDYEITVPHGWTAQGVGRDASLKHATGASLLILNSRSTNDFSNFTVHMAEGVANPLGFATISKPRHFSNSNQEWFEYDIRGNRLADHRRILYRAIRTGSGLTEIIFESAEDRFDILLPEALSIASSLKSVPRKVRVRK